MINELSIAILTKNPHAGSVFESPFLSVIMSIS